ncbi:MAG: diheme cytochrome c [Sideroxydans sp.]
MQMKFHSMLLLAVLAIAASPAQAEEDFWNWLANPLRQKEINPVSNATYQEECGSCHFAYQPGLLPSQSWEKLLNDKALADHFGENAELDADTLKEVRDFALENAAEKSYYKRARKIAKATENGEAPLRITEVRYIKRKHNEIPEKMIKGNKDVKSLSYCDACHTQAKKGVFDEDTVRIPNYPDWED